MPSGELSARKVKDQKMRQRLPADRGQIDGRFLETGPRSVAQMKYDCFELRTVARSRCVGAWANRGCGLGCDPCRCLHDRAHGSVSALREAVAQKNDGHDG